MDQLQPELRHMRTRRKRQGHLDVYPVLEGCRTPDRPLADAGARRPPCLPPGRCRRSAAPAAPQPAIPAPDLLAAIRSECHNLLEPSKRLLASALASSQSRQVMASQTGSTPWPSATAEPAPAPHAGTRMRPGGSFRAASATIARLIQGWNLGASSLRLSTARAGRSSHQ